MAVLPVEKAEAGMVLAGEVRDRRGRLLVPAGQVLEEKHIHALELWGVTHVEVEGEPGEELEEAEEEVEPWAVDAARADLEPLFAHADRSHPAVEELFRICLLRRAREIQRDGGDGN